MHGNTGISMEKLRMLYITVAALNPFHGQMPSYARMTVLISQYVGTNSELKRRTLIVYVGFKKTELLQILKMQLSNVILHVILKTVSVVVTGIKF